MPKNTFNNQPNFLEENEVSRDLSMYDDDYEGYDDEMIYEEQPERDFESQLESEKQKSSSMLMNTINAMLGRPTEYTDIDYKLRTSKTGQAIFMVFAALLMLGIFALFIIFK